MWTFQATGQVYSSLINNENCVLFTSKDHYIYCIEYTENNCALKFKINLYASLTREPHIFNLKSSKYIAAVSDEGDIYIIDFESADVVSYYKLPNQSFSSPRVYKDNLVIGCRDNYVHCYKLELHKWTSLVHFKTLKLILHYIYKSRGIWLFKYLLKIY